MPETPSPPGWVVDDATRLTLPEFGAAFTENWRTLSSGLRKVETWQTYQEPDSQSLAAFRRGEYDLVGKLLVQEAEADDAVYSDVRRNETSLVRLRLIKLPLSEYLSWEFRSYELRAQLGETVLVIDRTEDPRGLPNDAAFDFLLFDDRVALVHDYGRDGLQVGGWFVTARPVLDRLAGLAIALREESKPLEAVAWKEWIDHPEVS